MEQNITDSEQKPVENNGVDLDAILAGYTKKMDIPVTLDAVNPGPTQTPGTAPTAGPLPNPNNIPFSISRDANANTFAPTEYYVRGPKKGQPKPPKKVSTPNGQQIPLQQQPQPTQLNLNTLITGAMFITLIDLLIPMSIAGLNNMFNKSVQLDSDQLRMTDRQKNDLSAIGDAVVRELKINAPHWVLMLIALFGIYGFNAVLLIKKTKNDQQRKKNNEKDNKDAVKNNSGKNGTIYTP